jgi:hypothetical protein
LILFVLFAFFEVGRRLQRAIVLALQFACLRTSGAIFGYARAAVALALLIEFCAPLPAADYISV